jgi:hypothetical protein
MESLKIVEKSVIDVKKDSDLYKKLKQLIRSTTGEQLQIYDDDNVVLCYSNNKVIGFCCISMKSPESHFENEIEMEVPYLYNYICHIQHKKKKPSVVIMNYLKSVNSKVMNLDVLESNLHAQQFFEKNKFSQVGNYQHGTNTYISYTFMASEP